MEFYELCTVLQASSKQCLGVLVPHYFQWSLVGAFRQYLQGMLVIPIACDMAPSEIIEVIQLHHAYFPKTTMVLLYDKSPEYFEQLGIEKEYILCKSLI
jgi:hypothetical protein